jgi:hypothetical protein
MTPRFPHGEGILFLSHLSFSLYNWLIWLPPIYLHGHVKRVFDFIMGMEKNKIRVPYSLLY